MREFDPNDRTPVPNLRGGNFKTVAFILGPLLGACVIVGGIIWAMAKYPDRAEFEDAKREMRQVNAAAERRAAAIEQQAALTTLKVETIQKTTERIENKLDKRR